MPEVTIKIGGREFEVACQPGEEQYLQSAAKMLDDEAQVMADQIGRMPEARMLLMAGLMLADRTASIEDKATEVEAQLTKRDAEISALKTAASTAEPQRIEVPVVPQTVTDTLAEMAARAEAMAAELEEKTAS